MDFAFTENRKEENWNGKMHSVEISASIVWLNAYIPQLANPLSVCTGGAERSYDPPGGDLLFSLCPFI